MYHHGIFMSKMVEAKTIYKFLLGYKGYAHITGDALLHFMRVI